MIPGALIAFAIAVGSTPGIIVLLRRLRVVDVPNKRSSHARVTPRGGGIALVAAAIIGLFAAGSDHPGRSVLLMVSGLLAMVGLIDDLRTLDALPRLGAQFLIVAGCLGWNLSEDMSSTPTLAMLTIVATILVVGFVNAFNFMDGINGISALTTVIAGATFATVGRLQDAPIVGASGLVICAAALGFLPFNFPTAKVFLGDVGSYFLGGWLATTAFLAIRAGITPEAVIAPLVLYVADTSATLCSRIARREKWTEPHREHVYQRLVDIDGSHTRTTLGISALTTVISILGLATTIDSAVVRLGADLTIVVIVVAYLVSPQIIGHRRPEEATT